MREKSETIYSIYLVTKINIGQTYIFRDNIHLRQISYLRQVICVPVTDKSPKYKSSVETNDMTRFFFC